MSNDELIDSRVSLKQCRQAVEALHSYELKKKEKFEETQLLPGKDQHIWLNVTIKQIPAGHKFKPIKIPIVHPLVDPRTTSICLFTKDPQRQYKDLLETHNIKFISRVVGVEKLKGKFKAYEARRMLLKENGLFLADERIIPLLPKLLGSKWFEAKKQPIPVRLTRKDLKGELEHAISSTYMNQNRGTCTSIKVGKMSQTPSHILENLQMALPAVAKATKGGWDNIQNFAIKTNSSVSLPIWSCTLVEAESGTWNGLQTVNVENTDEDAESDSEEDEEEAKVVKEQGSGKGRKRVTDSDEEEKPRKKSKALAVPEPSEDKSKKRKVPKSLSSPTSAAPGVPLKKTKSLKPASSTTSPSGISTTSPAQDKFKDQQTKGADILIPPSGSFTKASISKKEMRQKRSANTGEKKKRIMITSKRAKSVKNAVLGKIVGQE